MNRNRSTCEQCHTGRPHDSDLLNEHTLKVACQTCHIPSYARANATKMAWDWSTAGRLRNGEPFEETDTAGNLTYASIKGTFTWQPDVVPDYVWFNGTAGHYLIGDRVSTTDTPISAQHALRQLRRSGREARSGEGPPRETDLRPGQIKHSIQPKLYAAAKRRGRVLADFDWGSRRPRGDAGRRGCRSVALTRSSTAAHLPVNHMVAPKERALTAPSVTRATTRGSPACRAYICLDAIATRRLIARRSRRAAGGSRASSCTARHASSPSREGSTMTRPRTHVYRRFERFWHWTQAALILFLASRDSRFTGR